MPRRVDPDQQDSRTTAVRCPRCRGRGTVYSITAEGDVPCGICHATGTITAATYRALKAADATDRTTHS